MNTAKYPSLPILLVDDEMLALKASERLLRSNGFNNIVLINDSREVMNFIESQPVCLIILDLFMPHITGDILLAGIHEKYSEIPVIILTGLNEIEKGVSCMKAGAVDYLVKPVEECRLHSSVAREVELFEIKKEYTSLKDHMLSPTLQEPDIFSDIITRDPQMFSIFKYIESIAQTPKPVLITGETGVGKEYIAKSIQAASKREGKFISVNVAGLDDNIFSDTLFGHFKGSFTGADASRKGLIETAAGGTLFLDEIGDLSVSSQVKLLRLLQEDEYMPLGSDMIKKSNARLVLATNHALGALTQDGSFRKDLYYRLITHHINVPPLRDRKNDIPLLVEAFLEKAAQTYNRKKPTPPKELFTLLQNHHFPGNIRELEAVVFDAVGVHTSKILSLDVFKSHIQKISGTDTIANVNETLEQTQMYLTGDKLPTIKEATSLLIAEALKRAHGNQTVAAQLLGISRTALNKRLKNKPAQ